MNITQFKYAIEVERTGSISQAAENLYMAQRAGAWNFSNWRGACFCRWSRWRPCATIRAATCSG